MTMRNNVITAEDIKKSITQMIKHSADLFNLQMLVSSGYYRKIKRKEIELRLKEMLQVEGSDYTYNLIWVAEQYLKSIEIAEQYTKLFETKKGGV